MKKTNNLLLIAPAKKKVSVFSIVIIVLLILYSAFLLTMLIWAFISSFKTDNDFTNHPFGLPEVWVIDNYVKALTEFEITRVTAEGSEILRMPIMFFYGFLYAIGCAFASAFVPCIVGYLCAKYNYKFSKIIFVVVIVCMIIPIVGNLPAEIQMARDLGLYNQIWGMWIMKANFLGLYFIVFYNYFKNLPNAYSEAAKIDGSGNFGILFKVNLPMALPLFFTVMLITFITYWNDYQTPYVYLESYPTIAVGMYVMAQGNDPDVAAIPIKIASAFLVLIPVLILFLIFHKKLLGNLTMGGIKG